MSTLKGNPYPGRGIIIGTIPDGKHAVYAYFIMGRSENSRNRCFEKTPDGIRTRAIDPSKMSDPSLIIYNPVKKAGKSVIITNGDQTDTIAEYISNGGTFEEALMTRRYEPDEPNFTPRISGILTFEKESFSYKLSILKKDGDNCLRCFYCYEAPKKGVAHLIHTYEGDGSPLPSFCGEPREYPVSGGIKEFAASLWSSLDTDNRISLYVNFTDLRSGAETAEIINGGIKDA